MHKYVVFCPLILLLAAPAQSAEEYNHKLLPTSPRLFNSISTNKPVIALTFDDGPHPIHTVKLLDILQSENISATFFVVGRNIQMYPELVKRMSAEGHEVGNHTWSHPSLPSVSLTRLDQELTKTSDLIQQVTGHRPSTMRPPYGALSKQVRNRILDQHKMNIVLWSTDPLDWKKPSSQAIRHRLVEGAHPGGILLAHDIHAGTIKAIPHVIQDLKSKGYQFVTITQLLDSEVSPDGHYSAAE